MRGSVDAPTAESSCAAGICTAVALDEEGWPGGVSIQLEHRDSEPFTLVHPYRRAEDGTTTWGEAFRHPG